jgi:hypothetical protein
VRPALPIRTGISAGLVGSGARGDGHKDRENEGSLSTASSDRVPQIVQAGREAVRSPSSGESNTDNYEPVQERRERFINQTLNLWQRRSPRLLTREDARQIAENVTGFFNVLMEWEARSSKNESGKPS